MCSGVSVQGPQGGTALPSPEDSRRGETRQVSVIMATTFPHIFLPWKIPNRTTIQCQVENFCVLSVCFQGQCRHRSCTGQVQAGAGLPPGQPEEGADEGGIAGAHIGAKGQFGFLSPVF